MSKFTEYELEQVSTVLEIMSRKINIGYKNAIENGTLPDDLTADKELYDYFVKSVKDFNRIRDILINNDPQKLTNDELNEIACLCSWCILDALNMGGVGKDLLATPIDTMLNVIFKKKRLELFGKIEPPSFMKNKLQPSNNKSESGGCYVATVVYGSYDSSQVIILRKFRDLYLQKRNWGRKFISLYYKYSPKYANKLKYKKVLSKLIRKVLDIIINILKKRYNY